MNTESREHLSSFMDGEAERDSARFLVRRLAADDGLRNTWARYHLIRDCLRHQEDGFVTHDFQSRVRGALADEPTHRGGSIRGRWVRSVAGSAIAAGVALAAVLVVGPERAPAPQPAVETAEQPASIERFVSPNIGSLVPGSQPVNLSGTEAGPDREINSYLLRHYQVTGEAGGRGFVSFVPIVVTQGAALPADDNASATSEPDGEAETLRR